MNAAAAPISPLLARLDEAIPITPDPIDAACLRAERSVMLARLGHLDAAHSEIRALRELHGRLPSARLGAWLCLAEGLAGYFRQLEPSARSLLREASTLSLAARVPALHALAVAWLAHLDYVRQDVPGLVRHVAQALQVADADDHASRARACLVAALAYHSAGQAELAQPWYRGARLHAASHGDGATISALMHNMAWLRAHRQREAALWGRVDEDELRQVLVGVESTERFDAGVGTAALGSLLAVLRAQVLVLLGAFAPALALYEAELANSIADGLGYLEPCFRADMAWCHAQLGRPDAARRAAEAALASLHDACKMDDRAYALRRCAMVFESLGAAGDRDRAAGLDTEAQVHRLHFHDHQAALLAALGHALEGLNP